ncbi:hypothetical protein [Bradyrhizobium yuanmingense]|uniref:hypothetical protein n=1 Tax=Bradyrhizobium yuanmingense TaxID=108015 RepID=UPI003516B0C4
MRLRLFVLLIFAMWAGAGPALAEKRVALVIGNCGLACGRIYVTDFTEHRLRLAMLRII